MISRIVSLPKINSFFLFGPRQTGKSTLVRSLYPDNVWFINLLQSDVTFPYAKDPSLFRRQAQEKIKSGIRTIVLDEIQRVPPLLNEAQALMDESKSIQFIFTGSSARKLKRGAANLLGGRAVERFLHPFVYEEIQNSFSLEQVLLYGTLPAVYGMPDTDKKDVLRAYTHTYLREEIQAEGISRNIGGFSKFLDVAAAQNGELLNFTALGRECQLPTRTVQSYYGILEDTLIGMRLKPWSTSARRRLTTHPKFYFFDLGVTNAINHRLDGAIDPVLRGRLFEHFVVLEVLRKASYEQTEAQVYYWRTNHGAEVDLLIEKHGSLRAACEIKSTAQVASADLSGLRSFRDDNPTVPCFVIAQVPHAYELNGIKIVPWPIFLTSMLKDWL
jgi:predicted AAA+ superfamily ATPase